MIRETVYNNLLAALLLGMAAVPLRAAEPDPCAAAPHPSVLLPAEFPELYERPLSEITERERWRIAIHGLRLAPLHPSVWAGRIDERTENRRLVPMKPFYLRLSECPETRVEEVAITFRFKPARDGYMRKNPHSKDPLLDIGFHQSFVSGPAHRRAAEDHGYTARLTAFEPFESGIFYRAHSMLALVAPARAAKLEVGRSYTVRLRLTPTTAELLLDGEQFSRVELAHADRGLISLMTGWHPLIVESLEVSGRVERPGSEPEPFRRSGLIVLPKSERTKSGAPRDE